MDQQQRRTFPLRDEVHPIQRELRERVQRRLGRAPVVAVAPVRGQRLGRGQRQSAGPVVGPAHRIEAAPEVVQHRLVDVQREALHSTASDESRSKRPEEAERAADPRVIELTATITIRFTKSATIPRFNWAMKLGRPPISESTVEDVSGVAPAKDIAATIATPATIPAIAPCFDTHPGRASARTSDGNSCVT